MQPGDLVTFSNKNPHPSMEGWFGRLALVVETEIRPVFPGEPAYGEFERITVVLGDCGQISSSPASNWRIVEEGSK